MASFTFRFEAVLRQREAVEQARLRDLATARTLRVETETRLRTLADRMRSADATMRDGHLTGRLDVAYVMTHLRHSARERHDGGELTERLSAAMTAEREAATRLAEASRRLESIRTLREQEYAFWRRSRAKAEQARLDDIRPSLDRSSGGV